jgi:3-hydroxyisobutyrate dehydrogenase-like beta-hydroxyacid dehydrogenase
MRREVCAELIQAAVSEFADIGAFTVNCATSFESRDEHDMVAENTPRLGFIGFGEAGQALASGLQEDGVKTETAWDILFPEADKGARLRQTAERLGVRQAASAADAVAGADIIIAAVTAASSLEAAAAAKPHLKPSQFYLDINSVSPGRKQETAELLRGVARYVDVAVMAPVQPARHKTPVLLAGEHAEALAPMLHALGMKANIAGAEIGAAAAIKMVRSVMIKGIEALCLECFLAASRAGVEPQIVVSLAHTYPGIDWPKVVAYNLERMANHGDRRAHEMEEVADTLRELGISPFMTAGTIERQRQMGQLGKIEAVRATLESSHTDMLKAISAALPDRD